MCWQPSQLDYFQIVFTLCDLLVNVYEKLASGPLGKELQPMLMKVDGRFKVCTEWRERMEGDFVNNVQFHLVNVISKDLTTIALNLAKANLATPDALYTGK